VEFVKRKEDTGSGDMKSDEIRALPPLFIDEPVKLG